MAMFRSGVDQVTMSHVKLEGEVTAPGTAQIYITAVVI
jgi:hypothetical protein